MRQHAFSCPQGSELAAQYPSVPDDSLNPLAAAEAELSSVCSVHWVGDWPQEAGEQSMSLEEYHAAVAAPAKGCSAYLLAQPPSIPACKAAEAAAASSSSPPRALVLTALISWPGRSRGLGATLVLPRLPSGNATLGVNMAPAILEGLSVGLLLLLITLVGLYCITTVAVPDVLHTDPMPAGKEY